MAKAGPTSFLLFHVYLYLTPDTLTFPGPRHRAYLLSILYSSGERPTSTLGNQGTSPGLCPHFSTGQAYCLYPGRQQHQDATPCYPEATTEGGQLSSAGLFFNPWEPPEQQASHQIAMVEEKTLEMEAQDVGFPGSPSGHFLL